MVVLGVVALAASVYLVYVLEILKFKGLRARDLRAERPSASEAEIEEKAEQDVETGEFDRVR
jgi:UDP-GlcNAc:undecaprenyl-phosphate GlcNAc-1-phosphate transferase